MVMGKNILISIFILSLIFLLVTCESNNSRCKDQDDINNNILACDIQNQNNSEQGQIPTEFAINNVCFEVSQVGVLLVSISLPVATSYQ